MSQCTDTTEIEDLGRIKLPIPPTGLATLTIVDVVLQADGRMPWGFIERYSLEKWGSAVPDIFGLARNRIDRQKDPEGRAVRCLSAAQIRPESVITASQVLAGHGPKLLLASSAPGLVASAQDPGSGPDLALDPFRIYYIGEGFAVDFQDPPTTPYRLIVLG